MKDGAPAGAQAGSGGSAAGNSEAEARDRISDDRDGAAEQRDARAAEREAVAVGREGANRPDASTTDRDRVIAEADRRSSAADRLHAAADRDAAAADRSRAAAYSDSLLIDGLTGVYRRGPGLSELERGVAKARRTTQPFVLAFIDVDHLKEMNDAHGHPAGDRLLARVGSAIRSVVRDYDVVVRYGGDEFICGTLGLDVANAQARFDALNASLFASGGGTASVGVVRVEQGEALEHAIARADAAMYVRKRAHAEERPEEPADRRHGSVGFAIAPLPRRIAEGGLRESMDALQEPLVTFDAIRDVDGDVIDLRYGFLNPAAERLYGKTSEAIRGQSLRELFPSVVELGVFACYCEPLRTGRPCAMRVPWFDQNGVVGSFDVVASPYGDGVVVTARDVTDEVEALQGLAESQALLRVVLDSTSDAIMQFGPDLRAKFVNRRLVEMTGIAQHDWKGKTLADAGYPAHLTRHWDDHSRRVFSTGEPELHEFEIDLPDGRRWIETRLDPVTDADGMVTDLVTTSRDVTDRRRAETEQRDSAALLGASPEGARDDTTA